MVKLWRRRKKSSYVWPSDKKANVTPFLAVASAKTRFAGDISPTGGLSWMGCRWVQGWKARWL